MLASAAGPDTTMTGPGIRITMRAYVAIVRDVRTTVNIDDHLLVEAKQVAVRTGRSLGDVADDALRFLLARHDENLRERVVLPTDGGSGLRPGVDLNDKEAMAELLGDNLPPVTPIVTRVGRDAPG